ncbi:uncharacterized protein [Miscanthus floridulus]|uniref:uncharacterized protein n=1 Tax=Miscanthus floridulus TaxID=154761 RepID=UPI0034592CA9
MRRRTRTSSASWNTLSGPRYVSVGAAAARWSGTSSAAGGCTSACRSRAFRHYVQEHKGRHHPNRKEKLYVKTLCACPKQKPRSLHCGYYTCIMMSTIGGYNRNPNLLEKDKDTRRNPYKDDELLAMVGDFCNFIMDQIVYHKGTYHHLLSDLGSNPLYQLWILWNGLDFVETDRLALGR